MKKQILMMPPPGSILRRQKIGMPFITHYGLFTGNNRVIENNDVFGVREISLQEFVQGMTGELRYETLSYPGPAIAKAKGMIGRPYDLFKFNCEHFVNIIKDGSSRSPQINRAVGFTSVLAAIAFLTKR